MAKNKKTKRASMRDKAKRKAQDKASSGIPWLKLPNGVELFKKQKGTMKFDIVPYEVSVDNHPEVDCGEDWYQRSVFVHYGIGAEDGQVICPLKTFGTPCPICEHRAELMKDPDADEDDLDKLKPKERELYNVKHEDELKVYTDAYFNFGDTLDEEIREDEDDEYGTFADLEGGYTLKVRYAKKSFGGNSFLKASKIDFIPRKKDLPESIMDEVVDLDKALKVLSYDEIHNMYYELGASPKSTSDEDDEEETPKSKKEQTKSKSKKKEKEPDPPEDEDEDEPEEIEDDEDNECPLIEEATMGDDFDEYEECEDCPSREKCEAMSEPDVENDSSEDEDDDESEEEESDDEDESEEDSDDECPHGHVFGKDCDSFDDDCDDCDCWDKCQDALEEYNKKKAPSKTEKKKEAKKPKKKTSAKKTPKKKKK